MERTILLLHGALGSKAQMLPLQQALESNFKVVSMSFSGHGGLPLNGQFDINSFTNDVITFLESENINQVDIFGFSMGGYVALNLALHHPEKVGKIHTLGTKLEWSPATAQKEIKMLDAEKIEEKVPAFAKILADRHAPVSWKEVLQETAQMMVSLGDGAALDFEKFKNINHPVVIGIGDEDNMVSIEESKKVADILPKGRMHIFKGFKHPIEQINVTELAGSIREFIEA